MRALSMLGLVLSTILATIAVGLFVHDPAHDAVRPINPARAAGTVATVDPPPTAGGAVPASLARR